MASTITSPTYDPTSTATAMAQKYTAALQETINTQSTAANAVDGGLTQLSSAISAFQTSLSALTDLNKTMFAQSASFSDTTVGSATADASAAPGAYSFFVQQLATASQVSYSNLTDDSGVSGNLVVKVGASSFTINTATANTDGGALSVREIAAAINSASGNASLVTASVISTGGTNELVLTAKNTGAASAVSLDTTGLSGGSLKTASANTLVAAKDAIIHVGSASGTAITQASNTFTSIAGVKMTFTRAQAGTEAPVTLTVAADNSTTGSNVQAFVDAYNKLKGALDKMVDPGDPANSTAGGVFAHDAGIRALRDRLVSLLRPTGGTSLASYGITAARDGTLSVDTTRLNKQLAVDPHGLDTLIGSTSASAPSGIANALDTFLKGWSNSATGQIKQRQDANGRLHKSLTDRQADLDNQYNAAYERYLMQFTQLQALQSQMSSNSSMFDALFSHSNSN